jgi:formylmethanofuran dehydrogenase subunit C
MSKNRRMNLGDPLGVQDAVNLRHLDRFLKADGSSVMAGVLNMSGHVIMMVGQPASAGDVVTKGYVDNVAGSTHLDIRS